MGDVIRLIKSQKDCIEKLIPILLIEYENYKPNGTVLDSVNADYVKALKERDYSYIISILISKSAHDLGIDLSK